MGAQEFQPASALTGPRVLVLVESGRRPQGFAARWLGLREIVAAAC